MPKKVLPSAEAFERFCSFMGQRGFRQISRAESSRDFWRLELVAPSPREGREIGFALHANGLDVVVWTSILDPFGPARGKDSGWVLIRDGDDARYFSHPMLRTAGFLRRMYKRAVVAQLRVLNRPSCPICKADMRIARGAALKARYWECRRINQHPDRKPVWANWDTGLSREQYPKALDFVGKDRKVRRRYRKAARAAGKEPGSALLRRRPWKVRRPQNKRPAT